MVTLQDLLIEANSYLDLAAETPTGDDLAVRVNYAQQAVKEWASSYKWRQLKERTSYLATGATISLATNFRELQSIPTDVNKNEYPEISMEDVDSMKEGDRYCYLDIDMVSGSTMMVAGLSTDAILNFSWQRYPSSMATLTDVCELPDPDFVKLKIISYTLQSRSDERFPIIEAEAKRTLANMITREAVINPGGRNQMKRKGSAGWRFGTPRGI